MFFTSAENKSCSFFLPFLGYILAYFFQACNSLAIFVLLIIEALCVALKKSCDESAGALQHHVEAIPSS